MENFGNIKDTFKTIVIESILKKEKALSIIEILFSKYEKPLLLTKEMEIANDQSASR